MRKEWPYLYELRHEFSVKALASARRKETGSSYALVELCSQQIVHKLRLFVLISRTHSLVLEDEVCAEHLSSSQLS